MEKDFSSKVLRPGDKGYVYDKRIDFSSTNKDDAEGSWDEDDNGEDDDYFDDDFAWEQKNPNR